MADYVIPMLLILSAGLALRKRENIYDLLISGSAEGLKTLGVILPSLVILLTGVEMLRVSGAMDALGKLLSPLFSAVGIPEETALLVLVRPISGSAALAVGAELMKTYGVDSVIGRTAAVMLGATETTFYTISVYFGANGIQNTRYTIFAALFADFVGFFMASLWVRVLF